MRKIYVVSSGDYSDYGINGIFDNKELAQSYIDAFDGRSGMAIEEYELNPFEEQIKSGRKAFRVRMDRLGNVDENPEWMTTAYSTQDDGNAILTYDKKYMILYCFAKDKKHAIKIANEKRAQLIANNLW